MDSSSDLTGDVTAAETRREQRFRWRLLLPVLILGLFLASLGALHGELARFRWSELWDSVRNLPPGKWAGAFVAALGGYLAVLASDRLAHRFSGRPLPLPLRVSAIQSFTVQALSLNMGAPLLSNGSVRVRLASRHGFSGGELLMLTVACTLFTILGQTVLASVVFLADPAPSFPGRILGLLLGLITVGVLAGLVPREKPFRFQSWRLASPSGATLLGGTILGVLEWACAAMVLLILLPPVPDWSMTQVLSVILLAHLASTVSGIPGGLGILELVLVALLPERLPDVQILGAAMGYRLLYLLGPLGLALVAFGWQEREEQRSAVARRASPWLAWWRAIAPSVVAATVFASGVILLISGNTPALPERMRWLAGVIPLFLVETSHFLASVAGLVLLVLAWSLRRRVNAAWYATVSLLGAGILLSLVKGLDWEEALLLAIVLAALLPLRNAFYREATLLSETFSSRWWFLTLLVLAGAGWIGFMSYRHVEYRDDLWWRFAYVGDAPRFLRSLAGTSILLFALALGQMLRPSVRHDEREPQLPDETIRRILEASPDCEACLAWLGDKRFLVNETEAALLIYGTWARSRIVLGDPIGPERDWEALLWKFRDECAERGMRPVIYGLSEENAHHYLDVGLQLFKAGEEARVHVPAFSLAGGRRKDLRRTLARFQERGCHFEILPCGAFDAHETALRSVSDAWLKKKNVKEKSFSLGSFRPGYLRHFPFAVVRMNGTVIAFANLFLSGTGKFEYSLDLMRYDPDAAPNGTIDYLFTQLLLWGQTEGYEWFSLGVAPLSGLERRPMAPLWHKVGATIFQHAEHFYNFQGLRAFKDKFDPHWISAYVAVPGVLDLPPALLDTSALVSGGMLGMVRK